jgi:hypothetical protein
MGAQVVGYYRRNKVIAVVVTGMHSQGERLLDSFARSFEKIRMELFGEEFIVNALINEDAFGEGRFLLWRPTRPRCCGQRRDNH